MSITYDIYDIKIPVESNWGLFLFFLPPTCFLLLILCLTSFLGAVVCSAAIVGNFFLYIFICTARTKGYIEFEDIKCKLNTLPTPFNYIYIYIYEKKSLFGNTLTITLAICSKMTGVSSATQNGSKTWSTSSLQKM
jgi:hypothetical protein